jgi:putative phage-type endonuclease
VARIIELEQNSQPWLQWRLSKIGGSDANIIAAYFIPNIDWPYGTSWPGGELYKLWMLKTGRVELKDAKDKSWGDYVDPKAHGHRTEDDARAWYCGVTGEFAPPVCIEHEGKPYLSASLDGFTGDRVVEIKAPKEPHTHILVKEGTIPDQYYAQTQHNLFVAGVEKLDFVSYFEGEGVITEVTPDAPFLHILHEAEEVFWGMVQNKVWPLPQEGTDEDETPMWTSLIKDHWTAQAMLREAEKLDRRVKKNLAQLMAFQKVRGGGAVVSLRISPKRLVKAFERGEGLQLDIRRIAEEPEGE